MNKSIELKTAVLTRLCFTCVGFFLKNADPAPGQTKKTNFKTLKDFTKLNCLPLAMQARPPRGAEMLFRLGEGASPTESAGLCLALLHPAPKTL